MTTAIPRTQPSHSRRQTAVLWIGAFVASRNDRPRLPEYVAGILVGNGLHRIPEREPAARRDALLRLRRRRPRGGLEEKEMAMEKQRIEDKNKQEEERKKKEREQKEAKEKQEKEKGTKEKEKNEALDYWLKTLGVKEDEIK